MLASSNMLFIYCILCSVFDVVWFMRRDLYVMALYKCPVYVCMYVCMYRFSYTTCTLRSCCTQSKLTILKIRESNARALSYIIALRTPRVSVVLDWFIRYTGDCSLTCNILRRSKPREMSYLSHNKLDKRFVFVAYKLV